MFRLLPKILTLLIYVSAMVVSMVAHDPWHDHGNEQVFSHLVKAEKSGKSSKKKRSHGHHHGHSHSHAGHSHSAKTKTHPSHDHGQSHDHHHHDHSPGENCAVCDFTSLMCIEATIAQIESEGEVLTQLSQTALCYHVAFSLYRPPSRAPPVC